MDIDNILQSAETRETEDDSSNPVNELLDAFKVVSYHIDEEKDVVVNKEDGEIDDGKVKN